LAAKTKRRKKASKVAEGEKTDPWADIDDQGAYLHIGHFLTFQLTRLANAARANVTRRYLADFNLTVPEWRLLAMTVRFEPVRFSKLAASSSMDKGQASRTVQGLVRRGFIATKWQAPERGSAASTAVLVTTPKGLALHQAILRVAQRGQAQLLKNLTREERRVLHRVLAKLFSVVEPQGSG